MPKDVVNDVRGILAAAGVLKTSMIHKIYRCGIKAVLIMYMIYHEEVISYPGVSYVP